MQQIRAQDAAFLYMESDDNLTHITGFGIFDPGTSPGGKVEFDDLVKHVESRLDASPIFTRKLAHIPLELDYPYWVEDEHFDLRYHVQRTRLPSPGDWSALAEFVGQYHSRPLAMQRPPWEIQVVEGLDDIAGIPTGSFALAIKIHHVAVDGAAAMKFFAALTDRDAAGTPILDLSRLPAPARDSSPGFFSVARRVILNNATAPWRVARTVVRSFPTIAGATHRALVSRSKEKTHVPETRFNAKVSPHKVFDGTVFELDKLKALRKLATDSTLNDVVLAICAGALRRYLESHGELPEASLVAWVPINARRGADSDDGNDISAMTVPIHTNEPDAGERIRAIVRTTRDAKQSKSGVAARLMADLSREVPALMQALAAGLVARLNGKTRMCNLFVSNVPGSPQPVYMSGAVQLQNFGLAPLNDGMGLFITTPSYAGTMTFGITSTREIMPDSEFFVACLRESFEELKKLNVKSSKGRSRTKPTPEKRAGTKKAKAKTTAAKRERTTGSSQSR